MLWTLQKQISIGDPGTGKSVDPAIVGNELGVRVVELSIADLARPSLVGEHPDTLMFQAVNQFFLKYGDVYGLVDLPGTIREMEKGNLLIVFDEAAGLFPDPDKMMNADLAEVADPAALMRQLRTMLLPGKQMMNVTEAGTMGRRTVLGRINVGRICFALIASLTELEKKWKPPSTSIGVNNMDKVNNQESGPILQKT